jgi:hypothetical protein
LGKSDDAVALFLGRKMNQTTSGEKTPAWRAADAVLGCGRAVFSLAIAALGIEHFVCARTVADSPVFSPKDKVIPVIPWLPAIPWLAYLFGAILVACAAGLLSKSTRRWAGMTLGGLFFVCTIVLEVPKNWVNLGSMPLRTGVFEPLTIAGLAWLLAGVDAVPRWLVWVSRWMVGVSLIVFGVDHWLALAPIGSLLPGWIPGHVFWIGFFGLAFVAAGVSIGVNVLARWGAAGMGLMFAIWVFTLHLPRVLGWYGIPGAPTNPNEWSSLFIAVALWGGFWGAARES